MGTELIARVNDTRSESFPFSSTSGLEELVVAQGGGSCVYLSKMKRGHVQLCKPKGTNAIGSGRRLSSLSENTKEKRRKKVSAVTQKQQSLALTNFHVVFPFPKAPSLPRPLTHTPLEDKKDHAPLLFFEGSRVHCTTKQAEGAPPPTRFSS